MISNDTKAKMLRNRIDVLKARTKDNSNIIRALERELRNLES